MALVAFITDGFDGTAGQTLQTYSASWVAHPSNAINGTIVTPSYSAVRGASSSNSVYRNTADPTSADYSVTATVIRNSASGADVSMGVCARMSSSATTFYLARFSNAINGIQLYRFSSGSATLLGTAAATLAVDVARTIRLEVMGSGIKVYLDGSSTAAISSTDANITAAGFAGLRFNGTIFDMDALVAEYEAVGATHTVTADPVEQGSTTTRPGLTQTHVTTARAGAQGTTVTRPPVTQAHVVTARAVTLSGAVNRPAITQTHVVTARAVAHGSTVNAPAVEVGGITVVTARPVEQSSTVNAPSIIQTHIVTARPVAQGGTVTRPGQAQGHQAGSTRPGFEMSSRKVYVKRGKRIHIFDTVEDADEWIEAEDKARQVVNAAKPKPQAKAKVFKALDEAIPHEVVSLDVVRAMVDYLGIPVEMPTLEARQDWAEVARVALMARHMQDEEDIELLLVA